MRLREEVRREEEEEGEWPGGSGNNGSASTWKATDAIVEFFAAHPMP